MSDFRAVVYDFNTGSELGITQFKDLQVGMDPAHTNAMNVKQIREKVVKKIGTNDFAIREIEKCFAPGCTHTVWVAIKGSKELTEVKI